MENNYNNSVDQKLNNIRAGNGRSLSKASDRDKDTAKKPSEGERPTITYTVKEGDTMLKLAKEHGIRVKDIRKANDFGILKHIKAGEQILLPGSAEKEAAAQAAAAEPTPAPEAVKGPVKQEKNDPKISLAASSGGFTEISYEISKDETLKKIAKKFYCRPEEIKQLNGLKSDRIYEGSSLKIVPGTLLDTAYVQGRNVYQYAVTEGDSFDSIAARFSGTGDDEKISAEHIRNTNSNNINGELRPGQVLFVTKDRIMSKTPRNASHYTEDMWEGRPMANGEIYHVWSSWTVAADPEIPLKTIVTLFNTENGAVAKDVKVADRGNFAQYGRYWDASGRVAKELKYLNEGTANLMAIIVSVPKNDDLPPEMLLARK